MDERLEQAKRAAIEADVRAIEKRIHLMHHEKAVESMDLYGIPYQCFFDYLEQPISDPEQQPINPMYPKFYYPEDALVQLTVNDFDMTAVIEKCKEVSHHGGYIDVYCMDTMKSEVKQMVQKHIETLRGWCLFDDNWKKYFLYFLQGYDFLSFTYFDFYGLPEDNDTRPLIDKYIQLQSEYDPTKHLKPFLRTKEPYSHIPYNIDMSEKEIEEYNQLAIQYSLYPLCLKNEYGFDNVL